MDNLKILTLKCPSCGAGLEVSPDMDRFACGYCGTEQIVQRRGGTVTLKLLGDAIGRVQVGTDRTAAELAIRRLRDDIAAIDAQYKQRAAEQSTTTKESGQLFNFALGMGLLAWIAFSSFNAIGWGLGFIAVGAVMYLLGMASRLEQQKKTTALNAQLEPQRASILAQITEHEKLLKP